MSAARRCSARIVALAASIGGAGCGDDRVGFAVTFPDELTEAPARSLDVVLDGARSCDAASSLAFDAFARAATRRARVPYPVPDEADPLDGRGDREAVTVVVAARDADDLVIARGCANLDGRDRAVRVALAARPTCPAGASTLELALAVDASAVMQRANIGLEEDVRPALVGEIVGASLPFAGTPRLYVGRSDGVRRVEGELEEAVTTLEFEGPSYALDAASLAVRELRHRGRCGVEPVLLWLVAGADAESTAQPVDVALGIRGAEADLADDVFAFGLALQDGGGSVLEAALPPATSRAVGPVLSAVVLRFQLAEARRAFTARLR